MKTKIKNMISSESFSIFAVAFSVLVASHITCSTFDRIVQFLSYRKFMKDLGAAQKEAGCAQPSADQSQPEVNETKAHTDTSE